MTKLVIELYAALYYVMLKSIFATSPRLMGLLGKIIFPSAPLTTP